MRVHPCSAALSLSLAACAPSAQPLESAPPQPQPAPAPPTADDAEERAAAERARRLERLAELVDERLDEVARVRRLDVEGAAKVPVELIDAAGVRTFVREAIYEETTPEELRLVGRVEASLGVIPVGSDPEKVLLDLYQDGVLGLYDAKKDRLLVNEAVPDENVAPVLAHELAHRVQDLHYDLDALAVPHKGDSDREVARTMLTEGDAQATALAWAASSGGLESVGDDLLRAESDAALELAAEVSEFPVLTRMLQLPYTDGASTIVGLVQARGWSDVDALYAELPATSEQMLHLDKLLAREKAIKVRAKPEKLVGALPGHQPVWEDNIGEAALLAMFAEVESAAIAREAARGWGGDRYVAFDRTEQAAAAPVVVGMIAWDTKSDAAQAERVLKRYLDQVQPNDHVVQRKNAKIVYAVELDGASPDALAKAAWKAFSAR